MLQKLHEKIKGWVAGVIIAVVSATFVLWGVQYYLQSSGADGVVAKINGQKITLKQLTAYFQQVQHRSMMQTGHVLTDAQNAALKQMALQELILNNVLLQSARQGGFRVNADQVNAFITALPQFQENGHFSPVRYQQLLYANSITPYAFLAQVSDQLTLRQMETGIEDTAFTLPNEALQAYALMHQERQFNYMIIPQTHFLSSVTVTDKLTADYYQAHRDAFKSPEKVSIAYVELTPQHLASQVSVSEAEIKQYPKKDAKKALLQQKINALLTKESDQLSDIAYTNPTTLKPAAETLHVPLQVSPLFTQQGGEGITANSKVIAAAFSDDVLIQGNNSDPIELADGRVIVLRIQQHEPSRLQSLAEVSTQIHHTLQQQLAQAQAAVVASEIATTLNHHQSPNKTMASFTWRSLSATRDNTSVPVPLVTTAFTLTKNNPITTVALSNGDSAVIQLTAIKNPEKSASTKALQAIQQKLSTDWARLEYQLYVQSARDHAKIKIN